MAHLVKVYDGIHVSPGHVVSVTSKPDGDKFVVTIDTTDQGPLHVGFDDAAVANHATDVISGRINGDLCAAKSHYGSFVTTTANHPQ